MPLAVENLDGAFHGIKVVRVNYYFEPTQPGLTLNSNYVRMRTDE